MDWTPSAPSMLPGPRAVKKRGAGPGFAPAWPAVLLVAAVLACMPGCGWLRGGQPVPVDYWVIRDHEVLDSFETKAPRSCLVMTTPRSLALAFGAMTVEGRRVSLIPAQAFKIELFLGVARRGEKSTDLAVQAVDVFEGVLSLRYSAVEKPGKAGFNVDSLLVAVERDDFKTVQFVENGEVVKKIDMAAEEIAKR